MHAAAYTNVAAAEQERDACWRVNVDGTRNVVRLATRRALCLVHISTDYVFAGIQGMYRKRILWGRYATTMPCQVGRKKWLGSRLGT